MIKFNEKKWIQTSKYTIKHCNVNAKMRFDFLQNRKTVKGFWQFDLGWFAVFHIFYFYSVEIEKLRAVLFLFCYRCILLHGGISTQSFLENVDPITIEVRWSQFFAYFKQKNCTMSVNYYLYTLIILLYKMSIQYNISNREILFKIMLYRFCSIYFFYIYNYFYLFF